ncbi:MAG TPA: CHAT domain-containing protein [Gemmatimonadaceae bacterium]|nr:CHAT domain-containing protein [Gemmatimonadaceae bacterium]
MDESAETVPLFAHVAAVAALTMIVGDWSETTRPNGQDDARLRAATLMTSFYDNFRFGADAADVLAEAQHAAIHDPSRSAHLRWAGFVMTGAR